MVSSVQADDLPGNMAPDDDRYKSAGRDAIAGDVYFSEKAMSINS